MVACSCAINIGSNCWGVKYWCGSEVRQKQLSLLAAVGCMLSEAPVTLLVLWVCFCDSSPVACWLSFLKSLVCGCISHTFCQICGWLRLFVDQRETTGVWCSWSKTKDLLRRKMWRENTQGWKKASQERKGEDKNVEKREKKEARDKEKIKEKKEK